MLGVESGFLSPRTLFVAYIFLRVSHLFNGLKLPCMFGSKEYFKDCVQSSIFTLIELTQVQTKNGCVAVF